MKDHLSCAYSHSSLPNLNYKTNLGLWLHEQNSGCEAGSTRSAYPPRGYENTNFEYWDSYCSVICFCVVFEKCSLSMFFFIFHFDLSFLACFKLISWIQLKYLLSNIHTWLLSVILFIRHVLKYQQLRRMCLELSIQ